MGTASLRGDFFVLLQGILAIRITSIRLEMDGPEVRKDDHHTTRSTLWNQAPLTPTSEEEWL